MEIFLVLLLIVILFVAVKLFLGLMKVGIFMLTLPFKIIFGGILLLLLITLSLPVLLVIIVPLIPLLIIGIIITLLVKLAF